MGSRGSRMRVCLLFLRFLLYYSYCAVHVYHITYILHLYINIKYVQLDYTSNCAANLLKSKKYYINNHPTF